MARKTIFIGSATEAREPAMKVAQALSDKGFSPRRWWVDFPAGRFTFDTLLEISKSVDGAVLLFTDADKVWYRDVVSPAPRDNILVEYGLFAARLGKEATYVLRSEGAKMPSDMAGMTYASLGSDLDSAAERTVQHFERLFASRRPHSPVDSLDVTLDPHVVEQQLTDHATQWHTRDTYYGIEGARHWLAVVNSASYTPKYHETQFRHLLLEAVEDAEVRTFVSLGPGDAETDVEIALRLRDKEPLLKYIPVDISDGLLERSMRLLGEHVLVPIGILGDFEDRMSFIDRQLFKHASTPQLFSLLGNTFGNLDKFESSFINQLKGIMQPNDLFLLDASLAGPKWTRDGDRRGQHKSLGMEYSRFLAHGIGRRTGEYTENVLQAFEKRIEFQNGVSNVPGTKAINLVDTQRGRLVATIRRYDWQSLLTWIQAAGFQIIFSKELFLDDVIGDGVLLLKKTGRK